MNEERRINEELKVELERLRLIFENSPLGMGFIGVDEEARAGKSSSTGLRGPHGE